MPDPDKKVDDTTATDDTKNTATPGETGEDGKYTDEGLAALVDQISKGDNDTKDTSDSDAGDKGTQDTKDTKEEQMVPLSRLNAVIDERNRLREQVNTQPAPQQTTANEAPTVDDLKAQHRQKRQEWQKAVFENDQEAATKLLDEMDTLEEALDDARLSEVSNATRAQSADDIRYDNLLDSYKKQYPMIDKNSEDFDQAVVTEMFEVREAFVAGGMSWSQALEKAHNLVLKPLGATQKVKETTDTRTSDSKRNLADALSRQPADVSDVGSSADAVNNTKFGIDISRLTVEQFDKLPDDLKAKLRGDTLEEHHVGNR